jgi:Tfp pilus assembly protein PilO
MRIIIPLSFIIISIGAFFLVIDPIFSDAKEIRSEVSAYKTALDNSAQLQKIRDSLIEEYKNVKKEDKDRLLHFLPNNVDNIELILEIERLANLNGLPVKNFIFSVEDLNKKVFVDEEDGDTSSGGSSGGNLPYGVFPIEFTLTGRYNSFLNFLKEIESNLRLIDIRSVSLTVPNKTDNNTVDPYSYDYSLKVETYWLK